MFYAALHNGRRLQARTSTDSNSGDTASGSGLVSHGRGRHASTLHLVPWQTLFLSAAHSQKPPKQLRLGGNVILGRKQLRGGRSYCLEPVGRLTSALARPRLRWGNPQRGVQRAQPLPQMGT